MTLSPPPPWAGLRRRRAVGPRWFKSSPQKIIAFEIKNCEQREKTGRCFSNCDLECDFILAATAFNMESPCQFLQANDRSCKPFQITLA